MQLLYDTLDVFTERRFGGNPLAVVHEADLLTDEQMQMIAHELNLSETVFLQRPENPAHSARVRIFTPTMELPFAGHPTIGTAALLAEMRNNAPNGDAIVVLEQQIGVVRVGVRLRAGIKPFAEFDAPRLPAEAGQLQAVDLLAAGLGLIPSEIGFENHRPSCYAAGNAVALVPVASYEAITRVRVNPTPWGAAFEEQGFVGAFLYTRQCIHAASAFHARMFAPSLGIPEDPATGSAAVAFAGAIYKFDDLPDGIHKRTVEQGFAMQRPSFISLTLVVEGGNLTAVRIGGHCVRVCRGTLSL